MKRRNSESAPVRADLLYRWVTNSTALRDRPSTTAGVQETKMNVIVSALNGLGGHPSSSCELLPWNAELFCRSLRGRNILIVGDSLNQHWRAALLYLLGKKDCIREDLQSSTHGKFTACEEYYPENPIWINFGRNPLLSDTERLPNKTLGSKDDIVRHHYRWVPNISQYHILILNTGIWIHDPLTMKKIYQPEYEQRLQATLNVIKKPQYNGTIIWRTTPAGHPNCERYSEPLQQELPSEELKKAGGHRWEEMAARNQFSIKLWREAGAHILDVSRLTNLMPLGHLRAGDCLHYCRPSVVFVEWSRLLMNLLVGNLDT